jgi:3-oxoacyl-[acyl-carrier protein] reductase
MKSLDERVAIVTGAADGVGLGIARVLAAEGAAVVVADVDAEGAAAAARELCESGGRALEAVVDVTEADAVSAVATAALDRFGRIDILVANAGIYPAAEIEAITDELWHRVVDVNVKGALNAIKACLPAMREQRYGRIVLTSSITGPLVGVPGLAHYGATKAALLGLMRSAALEVAPHGITINAVLPGNVLTPGIAHWDDEFRARVAGAIPLGRLAQPEEVGWAVRVLASEELAYVTGQTLVIDGGQVLPEL